MKTIAVGTAALAITLAFAGTALAGTPIGATYGTDAAGYPIKVLPGSNDMVYRGPCGGYGANAYKFNGSFCYQPGFNPKTATAPPPSPCHLIFAGGARHWFCPRPSWTPPLH